MDLLKLIEPRVPAGAIACLLLPLAAFAAAQGTPAADSARSKVSSAQPCCAVVSVDLKTNTVTARVTATGTTFTFPVSESMAKRLKPGEALKIEPVSAGGKGFSGATGTTSGGGSSTPGTNTPRTTDTRPKDCVATSSSGAQTKIPCPQNVPIKTTK